MKVTAKLVHDLRVRTGAGILDCQRALSISDDEACAERYLRGVGLAVQRWHKGETYVPKWTGRHFVDPGGKVVG